MCERRDTYLDVLRRIFEGQQHVTISTTLWRSLSNLEHDFTHVKLYTATQYICISHTHARARVSTRRTIVYRGYHNPRHLSRRRGGQTRYWSKRADKRERDGCTSSLRLCSSLSRPLSLPFSTSTRRGDEDEDSSAARNSCLLTDSGRRTFTKVSTALLATSKSVGRPPK